MALLDGLGNKVFGSNFIGRKSLIRRLQDGCTTQNYSIVGLPKIGKSSLAYHSIIYRKEEVRRNNNREFVPVFVDCGPASSIISFFNNITSSVFSELFKAIPDDQRERLVQQYTEYEKTVEKKLSETFKNFFLNLQRHQIDIVIILDEFDRVRTINGFDGTHFALLRTIIDQCDFVKIVTISKRSLDVIEGWKEDKNHNPSNFYQCFNEIIVGNYTQEEWGEFWEEFFKEYGDDVGKVSRLSVMNTAFSYTGYNPFWMAFYAKKFYDSLKYNQKFDALEIQMEMIRHAYDPMRDFLCDDKNYRNNILDTVVQSIIGPVYTATLQDVAMLEQYGLLTTIAAEEKKCFLVGGEKSGIWVKDGDSTKSYIASNIQFTKYLIRELNQSKFTYWKEWEEFFCAWSSLLDHKSKVVSGISGVSLGLSKKIREFWDLEFKPVFGNNSYSWFSSRYNHVIRSKCVDASKLEYVCTDAINRNNQYLIELTKMITDYLAGPNCY